MSIRLKCILPVKMAPAPCAVKKSRSWLKKATAAWGAVIEQKTVSRWAKDLAATARI
ncbi:MAG TPA: hypothetical protein VMU36_13795 [Spirochaetia bacterium]|nr:hypothetical protein [Spirochaetia bacterium]